MAANGTRLLARWCAALGSVAAVALGTGAVQAQQQQQPPTAAEIYARARAVWRGRVVPPYIRYTTTMRTRVNRRISVERDEIVLRTRDRVAFVRAFRDGGAQNLVTITSPRLVPDSTFGLAAHAAASEVESPFAPEAAATSPPVIGRVVATTHPLYDVTLVGSENVDGRPCWHLALRPAPGMSGPLRDLWVDRDTADVRKLDGVIEVHRGPFHREAPFDAGYAESGAAWLLTYGHAAGGVHVAFLHYTGEGRIDFGGYTFPAGVPDWCFDRAQHAAHAAADAVCTSGPASTSP
jgi:hypothetical protein